MLCKGGTNSMKNYGEVVGAGFGTAITATGASMSFHETLQVVALNLLFF